MSLENRYDSILKDMITLLQEALFRFFTTQKVDINKFKHYFNNFNVALMKMQEDFHQNKIKHSKALRKIDELFNKSQAKFSLQPTTIPIPIKAMQPSEEICKPKFDELNIIKQEEEHKVKKKDGQKKIKQRSNTTEGSKRGSYTIDFENGRPKTGIHKSSDRYSHTIDSERLQKNRIYKDRERKSFYDDLERESQTEVVYENNVKMPKKKKNISSHRWSFKINKLF